MSIPSSAQPLIHQESRLTHFPVSFFSMIMGLSGLAIAWKVTGSEISSIIPMILALFSSLVMFVVTLVYLVKIFRHPDAVIHELKHPIRLNFFPAFSISLLLLSVVWGDHVQLSFSLWAVGTVFQFGLTLYVMSSWIHHTHYTLSHANPSWFIPVVGNIIVPISGVHLGYTELSWFFFSIGIVFWLVLLTIILYRMFFHDPLPARLLPMLFILLAPPSIGFISYSGLVEGLDNFGRVIYYIALFISMLLLCNVMRFIRLPFFISSWAFSFPIASLTIATTKMAHLTGSLLFALLAKGLLLVLSGLLLWLVVKTGKAIMAGELCVPE
jgi:tellurite resistance protein